MNDQTPRESMSETSRKRGQRFFQLILQEYCDTATQTKFWNPKKLAEHGWKVSTGSSWNQEEERSISPFTYVMGWPAPRDKSWQSVSLLRTAKSGFFSSRNGEMAFDSFHRILLNVNKSIMISVTSPKPTLMAQEEENLNLLNGLSSGQISSWSDVVWLAWCQHCNSDLEVSKLRFIARIVGGSTAETDNLIKLVLGNIAESPTLTGPSHPSRSRARHGATRAIAEKSRQESPVIPEVMDESISRRDFAVSMSAKKRGKMPETADLTRRSPAYDSSHQVWTRKRDQPSPSHELLPTDDPAKKRCHRYPGSSRAAHIILGTSHGENVASLINQHKQVLGPKMIEEIVIWKTVVDELKAEDRIWPRVLGFVVQLSERKAISDGRSGR